MVQVEESRCELDMAERLAWWRQEAGGRPACLLTFFSGEASEPTEGASSLEAAGNIHLHRNTELP